MQRAAKKAYRLDLASLHAVCEANYARLLRLFPDYQTRRPAVNISIAPIIRPAISANSA